MPKIIFNAEKTDGEFAFTGLITFNRVTLNVGNAMSSDGFVAPIAQCAEKGYMGDMDDSHLLLFTHDTSYL